jgi:hypothetical protein
MIIDPHGNPHFYVDLTDTKIRQLSALYAVVSEVRDTPIEDQPNPADVKRTGYRVGQVSDCDRPDTSHAIGRPHPRTIKSYDYIRT